MIVASLRRDASGAPPSGVLWLLVFMFAATVAVFVQFVILGLLFPEWSNGAGLLLNTDSIYYHRFAAELAGKISEEGWGDWNISPKGQFSVGFYGAVYALTFAKPWVAIPLNAAAHAVCAILIMRIMLLLVDDWRIAAVAALPYAVFPSSALLYSQLLKDGYFNVGVLLFCYGWTLLATNDTISRQWRSPAIAIFWILAGFIITGIIRPYALTLFSWISTVIVVVLLCWFAVRFARRSASPRATIVKLAMLAVCLVLTFQIKHFAVELEIVDLKRVEVATRDNSSKNRIGLWQSSTWLPDVIDRRLATVAGVRRIFLIIPGHTRSIIDQDSEFYEASDIVAYIPRALQIAFLAPFPYQWLEPGSSRATTIMRRVSMFEMAAVYGALLFVPVALWQSRRRPEIWVAVLICGSMLLVLGLSWPIVGALYRVRYAYLMVFVALGVVGAANWWRGRRMHD